MADLLTGTAGNTISSAIIVPLIQRLIEQIDDLRRLDENRELLKEQLDRMRDLLLDIKTQFQDQQREVPVSLKRCFERIQSKVERGTELIRRSQRPWPQQCIDNLLCKPKVYTEVREWRTSFQQNFGDLQTDISLIHHTQQIVTAAPQQEEVLLQDQPDTGLIGMKINAAETQLHSWVSEAPHVRIIAVYGMGGVGKTTLLKKVYNNFKVGRIFHHVIWVTVAQFPVLQMQNDIASAINLDLAIYSADMRKIKLSAYLKNTKFFLVLDDMWSAFDLKELGVEFGENKGSKVVFTTRNRDLIREMNAKLSMQIQPLLPEEGWELFRKVAFEDDHVPENIENIARQVAKECQGLPLAIKEDEPILVELLVQMWIAEGLMKTKEDAEYEYLLETGHSYVRLLLNRCLFQNGRLFISVHDVVHDMAIYIGENEENCVLRAGQSLQHFPHIPASDNCKRISVLGNYIESLPTKELKCPKLVSLFLGYNQSLKEIPEAFLLNFTSLRVLDLQGIPIKSLPTSLWQLTQLEYLCLSDTRIEHISEEIGNLLNLQFLNLKLCSNLKSLPSQIGELKNLKYLEISGCNHLNVIPNEITKLSHCKIVDYYL